MFAPSQGEDGSRAELLSVERYGVAFGERIVLADLSFQLAATGVTTIMGPAGTGKSTLLRSLAGLHAGNTLFRSWGRARLGGLPLDRQNAPTLVLQNPKLLGSRAIDHLADRLRAAEGVPRSPAEMRAHIVAELLRLDCADLVDALERALIDLPADQQRRLAIVGGAIGRPPLLMLDEPSAGLDLSLIHI